jgi:hypothetical protein
MTPKIGKFPFKPSPVVLDGIEIRRIGRQVKQLTADISDISDIFDNFADTMGFRKEALSMTTICFGRNSGHNTFFQRNAKVVDICVIIEVKCCDAFSTIDPSDYYRLPMTGTFAFFSNNFDSFSDQTYSLTS